MFKDYTNYENDFIKIVSRNNDDKIYPNGRKVAQWNCLCKKCNSNQIFVRNSSWIRDYSYVGCGCDSHDVRVKSNAKRTHGLSNTQIYKKWAGMKNRCNNSNEKRFNDYGGRGITYCNEWENFENFYEWAMKNGYKDGLSLERIDVNGNYCPENCKWITLADQQKNKRSTIWVNYNNNNYNLKELCFLLELNYKSVTSRIYQQGFSPIDAVTIPFDGSLYKSSSMELAVLDYLKEKNIKFDKNKKFDKLVGVGNKQLSYDFYLPQYNILIECQGFQHSRPVINFGGEKQFKIQKEHDRRKREYANQHQIKLIEIIPSEINNLHNILSFIK